MAEKPTLPKAVKQAQMTLEAPQSHKKRLEFVQKAIDQDSKRVAQMLKRWIGSHA